MNSNRPTEILNPEPVGLLKRFFVTSISPILIIVPAECGAPLYGIPVLSEAEV